MNAVVLPKPAGAETADVVMSASACGEAPRSTVQSSAGAALGLSCHREYHREYSTASTPLRVLVAGVAGVVGLVAVSVAEGPVLSIAEGSGRTGGYRIWWSAAGWTLALSSVVG